MIKMIIERITDAEPAVQTAALHAAITLAEHHAGELVNLGVIQLILPILANHIGDEQLYSGKQEQLFYQSLVSTSFYLISSLTAQNDLLLDNLKKTEVVDQCVLGILNGSKQVALAAIDLLQVFVESDTSFSLRLLSSQSQSFLSKLPSLDSETKTSLVNLVFSALEETQNYSEIFKYCLPVILELLNLDIHSEFLMNVSNKLDDNDFKAQEHFWMTEAKAQQGALEMLTNLLASEDGSEPLVLQHLSIDHIKFIAKAANGVSKDVALNLFNYPEIISVMIHLQYAAFSCIQNLILNTQTLDGFILEVWMMLIDHFNRSLEFSEEETEFQEDFIELMTILSKNLAALSKKYSKLDLGSNFDRQKVILDALAGVERNVDEMTENLMAVFSFLLKDEQDLQVVAKVVQCLVKCCAHEKVEVNTEALNVFFDAFNDERFDDVLQAAGIMKLMQGGVQVFKHKVETCEDLDVREHAQEALENLMEFIKYKAQHIRS